MMKEIIVFPNLFRDPIEILKRVQNDNGRLALDDAPDVPMSGVVAKVVTLRFFQS